MNLTSLLICSFIYKTHHVNRLHSGLREPYCPGRSMPIDNGYAYKRLHPNSLSLDAVHLLPYVDSASWLYLDPNPIFRLPSLEYDALIAEQHRHHHHHRHYHHHHRHRNRQRRHRRVLSDPGGWNAGTRMDVMTRHRRVLSSTGVSLMQASIDEANEDNLSPEEEIRASTFRKVPWHPNLHMLKIRRT